MDLLTRDRWGARPPKSVTTIKTPTSKLVLHHGAIPGEGPDRVRSYQRYHMDSRSYVDIAYSWLADSRYVYVGRGAGVQGGHTQGHNSTSHAVCAVGDYSTVDPSDALLDNLAAAAVHAWRLGAVSAPRYTHGHRDLGSTTCPGSRLYATLGEINRRAERLANSDGDDMNVTTPEDVRYYQGILAATFDPPHDKAGPPYNIGAIDGIVGPKTEAAIRNWQERRGIAVTGTLTVTTCITLQSHANRAHATEEASELGGGTVDLSGYAKKDHGHEGTVTVR